MKLIDPNKLINQIRNDICITCASYEEDPECRLCLVGDAITIIEEMSNKENKQTD